MTGRAGRLLAAFLVAGMLSACGVAPESTARPVPQTPPPHSPPSDPPASVTSSGVPEKLYLVKDNKLVAVVRRAHRPPRADELIKDLIAGPTDSEADRGLTSALLSGDVLGEVRTADHIATIRIDAGLDEGGRNDQVLAFGQIVCTVTQRPDIAAVAFTRNGQPVNVPRGDGALSTAPLTAADYTALIAG